MLYGVHVGHSFLNSIFYTAWLVYSYTQNILILNLFKTIRGMKSGLASIIGAVGSYHPTWFINLDQAAGISVRFLAMSCGEFSATSFWINGFISNYNSVYNTFRKLRKMSWFSYPTRNKNAIDSYKLWYLTRCTWPRTIFISNVCSSYQPAKESLHLGIPCIGIVDSNTYTHVVSIPIPGNDDSLDCLVFYNDFIAKFILLRKYTLIITWFLDTRKSTRLSTFKAWLKSKLSDNKYLSIFNNRKLKLSLDIKFRFNFLKNIQLGMNTLFSNNTKYMLRNFEYLDIFKDCKVNNNESIDDVIIWKKKMLKFFNKFSAIITDLKNLYFNKKLWATYKIVRNRFLKGSYFRLNLFTYDYFETNIKLDRFYKTHIRWRNLHTNVAAKFYKFFIIYNFARFKQLSTNIFSNNILSSVYFKLIFEQLFPKGNTFEVNIHKNYNLNSNQFSFFSFKNLYTLYNVEHKDFLLYNLFKLFNKKFWLKMSNYSRKRYFRQLKFQRYFNNIKCTSKIFKVKDVYVIDIITNYFFRLNYKVLTVKFICYMYSIMRLLKKSFYNEEKIKNYYNSLKKKIKSIKYNMVIKYFLRFIKRKLSLNLWEKSQVIIYFFILIILGFFKIVDNFFLPYFKNFICLYIYHNVLPKLDRRCKRKFFNYCKLSLYDEKKSNKNISHIFNSYKKKIISNNIYSNYLYHTEKHPFYNTIKYDYNLYLEKNPFIINTSDYWIYIKYNNFLKWKKTTILFNNNWRFFYKYSSNNKFGFFKDYYYRYKELLFKKSTLYSFHNNKNNLNYFLGWSIFNKPIQLRNWYYSREFFLFPSWFYNYKKNKNYFFNYPFCKINAKIMKSDTQFNNLFFLINLIRRSHISKNKVYILLDYIKIYLNDKIPAAIKKELLLFKLITLYKYFSTKFKNNILHKIRFSRKYSWKVKLIKLAYIEKIIDSSLNARGRLTVLQNIWKTKRYDLELKKKYIIEKISYFKQLHTEDSLRLNNIRIFFKNNKNILLSKKKKINPTIYKINSLLFKNKYQFNLLNKYNIESPLNNFFYKFYNIPITSNYMTIKNYLKNYKIILQVDKKNLKFKKRKNNFLNILLHKNPITNVNINLNKFVKMYGLRWF